MEIGQFPIGSDVKIDVSLSGGSVVINIQVSAKGEVDALLDSVKAKLPAAVQPLLDMVKLAADSALA